MRTTHIIPRAEDIGVHHREDDEPGRRRLPDFTRQQQVAERGEDSDGEQFEDEPREREGQAPQQPPSAGDLGMPARRSRAALGGRESPIVVVLARATAARRARLERCERPADGVQSEPFGPQRAADHECKLPAGIEQFGARRRTGQLVHQPAPQDRELGHRPGGSGKLGSEPGDSVRQLHQNLGTQTGRLQRKGRGRCRSRR
jgi:hypothetical protein